MVDDQSPDETWKWVQEKSKEDEKVNLLLRTEKNGFAEAYKAGLQWALDHQFDRILQMDADLSHPPEVVPKIIEALDDDDVAVGSRYVPGGGVENWGIHRKIISRAGNFYAQTVLGMPITDLTGGFVGWRADSLETINLSSTESKGYAFLIELKYRAQLSGLTFAQVPFIFPDRILGNSKMSAGIFGEAFINVLRLRKSKTRLKKVLS